jgi:hypothetical protein
MPTVNSIRLPGDGTLDNRPTKQTDISAEFSKRLTPDLGISLAPSYSFFDAEHGPLTKGFDNLEVSLKYVFWKSAEHETLLSAGVAWEVGGTGSKLIADSFDTATPQFFFGKGFGDLPDAMEFFKPGALTGAIGLGIPTRRHTKHYVLDDNDNVLTLRDLNPQTVNWGFSVQYNLQYLQSFVRDIGLPAPFNRMIPLVEFAMQTPIEGPQAGHTTGTINPGVIWFGRYMQLSLEAVVPANSRTGRNLGVLGQIHFYLDDIAPQIFTWTPFNGILGPTQPR